MTHLWLCAQLLQQNLEANFYSGNVSWDEVSPNDAAALLKKFIRELPAPLLTAEYLNTFSAVRGQPAAAAGGELHPRHDGPSLNSPLELMSPLCAVLRRLSGMSAS